MKLITILGARPQFIKAATVSRVIARIKSIKEIIIHTGQHFDHNMSQIFFDEMCIPQPDYNFQIHGGSHGAMTGQMLEKTEAILQKEQPDAVLVYGDTNSTLAGALAAVKLHIPVAHVEAGLRSFNTKMPEEINRIVADHISTSLFAPTQIAMENLVKEGLVEKACLVGDVMYDAFLFYIKQAAEKSQILKQLQLSKPFALATIHRAENTTNIDRLTEIMRALNQIHRDIPVVLALHPRTQAILKENPSIKLNMIAINPVSYFDMLQLLQNTCCVLTDSGGLQKEAFFAQKPCVTFRDETEWRELVDFGYNQVAGAEYKDILSAFNNAIQADNLNFNQPLYGDGFAAEKILAKLTGIGIRI